MHQMDPARWTNILQLDREYAAGQATLSARPLEAYIEVAARCNLRCQMCPIIVDPRYQSGSGFPALLSEEMFDRLAPVFPTLKRGTGSTAGSAASTAAPGWARRSSPWTTSGSGATTSS